MNIFSVSVIYLHTIHNLNHGVIKEVGTGLTGLFSSRRAIFLKTYKERHDKTGAEQCA